MVCKTLVFFCFLVARGFVTLFGLTDLVFGVFGFALQKNTESIIPKRWKPKHKKQIGQTQQCTKNLEQTKKPKFTNHGSLETKISQTMVFTNFVFCFFVFYRVLCIVRFDRFVSCFLVLLSRRTPKASNQNVGNQKTKQKHFGSSILA